MFNRKTKYPTPVSTKIKDWETVVGWVDKPYFVEIHHYDSREIYLSVKAESGYATPDCCHPGFIYSSTNLRSIERVLRRYLRIAWRRNNHAKLYNDSLDGLIDRITK